MIRELHILNDYLGGFIKGKLLDSLIIGVICMVFTACTNMPYAVLIGMNEQYFCRFFKKVIGRSPMEYVNEYRIKEDIRRHGNLCKPT